MNRADRLSDAGDKKRGFTVGFALTVLQRRLASSPGGDPQVARTTPQAPGEAPQRDALRQQLGDGRRPRQAPARPARQGPIEPTDRRGRRLDDLPGEEAEEIESEVADAATAARTIAELDKELALLADLIELARRVRHSGTDKKWTELRELLTDNTTDHRRRRARSSSSPSTATPWSTSPSASATCSAAATPSSPSTAASGVRSARKMQGAVHPGRRHAGSWSRPTPPARA